MNLKVVVFDKVSVRFCLEGTANSCKFWFGNLVVPLLYFALRGLTCEQALPVLVLEAETKERMKVVIQILRYNIPRYMARGTHDDFSHPRNITIFRPNRRADHGEEAKRCHNRLSAIVDNIMRVNA